LQAQMLGINVDNQQLESKVDAMNKELGALGAINAALQEDKQRLEQQLRQLPLPSKTTEEVCKKCVRVHAEEKSVCEYMYMYVRRYAVC
jgi:hypothetical protein